jgi:hypothetical protein
MDPVQLAVASLSVPPPAKAFAPAWESIFERLPPQQTSLLLPSAGAAVEVRILPELQRQNLKQGIQLGLYATAPFVIGAEVVPYGGILTHQCDYSRELSAWPKTHARRIAQSDFVLDGRLQAMMYRRPIPRTPAVFAELLRLGVGALLPQTEDFPPLLLSHFNKGACGFMANTASSSACNVRVGVRQVKCGVLQYPVPILVAKRKIETGEEILSPYGSNEAKWLLLALRHQQESESAMAIDCECQNSSADDPVLPQQPPFSAPVQSTPKRIEMASEVIQHPPPRGVALVLGMAFLNESRKTAPASGTSVASHRDRARLLKLQEEGYDIISMNKDTVVEHCSPHVHLQSSFSHRAVADLKQLVQRPLSFIFADYFRFPSEYLLQSYIPFLRDMLPKLITEGLVTVDTQMIIPWLPLGSASDASERDFRRILDSTFRSGNAPKQLLCGSDPTNYMLFEPIKSDDYPLYTVTEAVGQKDLGNYQNFRQLKSLDPNRPFLRMRLTKSLEDSNRSWNELIKSHPAAAASHHSAAASSSPSGGIRTSSDPPAGQINTNGWVLYGPDQLTDPSSFAEEWLLWAAGTSNDQWQQMPEERGGYFQINAQPAPESLHQRSREAGLSLLLKTLGSLAFSLILKDEKVLSSEPGKGLQEPHCDANSLKEGEQCYTVIFYLTEGESTALPDGPFDEEMREVCWFSSIRSASQKAVALSTYPVQPGSSLVLSQKVLHCAPLNKTDDNRLILFQQWIPRKSSTGPNSDVQRLPYGI